MNYIFISPNFPKIYSHFVKALKERGVTVLGIGDERYECLNDELKANLTEYCYVADLNNKAWMINTIEYLKYKYGKIDFIESNNEYWMKNDAVYREWFNIEGGYRPSELADYQSKSGMKKYFQKAGVKTARYLLVSSLEESLKFVEQVGYPVFAKPDSGVGAADTFKIKNKEDLKHFHEVKPNEQYIMEEFLDGSIVSFDGIANADSEVVVAFKETFPTPIAEVVSKNLDVFYFAESKMPKAYREMGERIIKAFNVKSRCFHTELFKLNSDKPGFAKKGEIVALEINLRSPGGETPELLNLVAKTDYYEAYASMLVDNVAHLDNETNKIAFSINRKFGFKYTHSSDDIMTTYKDNLKDHGFYPESFRAAMGDEFFLFVFENNKETVKQFLAYVLN
jgi:hypothetical protein